MKKFKKLFLIACGVGSLTLLSIPTVLTLTSCSKTNKSEVVAINNKYSEIKSSLQNDLGLPKYTEARAYDTNGTQLIENAKNAITELETYKKNNLNLPIDEQIWLDSYIYNWQTEINNYENGLQYLGGDPSGDALPLNPNSNHLDDNINSALNIYQIDEETLEPIADNNHIDKQLAKNYLDVGQKLIDYIKSLKSMLEAGMNNGVMPNNITKKLFVNQMLKNYYQNELLYWVNQSNRNCSDINLPVKNTKDDFKPTNAMLSNFDMWSEWASKNGFNSQQIENTKTLLLKAQSELDNFITWYAKDYYSNTNSYGVVNNSVGSKSNIQPLKILKTNTNNEIERIIKVNDISIYGLGVTNNELELKNIGLGFMNSSLTINNKTITGNDIYQALLQFNNSVNKTAVQLVDDGKTAVANTTKNMKEVAKQIAELNNPSANMSTLTWKPKVVYDETIGDSNKAVETEMQIYDNGTLNFAEFNKWLNQENFFFGRETNFWSQKYDNSDKTNLDAYTNPNTNTTIKKYLETLTTLGYAGSKGIWTSDKTIYGDGSVTGKQALAGAVLSLMDYNNFKNKTDNVFNYSFKEIPQYNVAPYNEKIQEIIGVGLEGPRGSNIFNYNVNPYFSLPKWSQSSFQNHEGKMGHHTQQAYWTKYMPNGEGKNGTGPGYVFKQDAFHEGWAVFAEWYANELGIYGTKQNSDGLPTDWLNANGFVPKIKDTANISQNEINAIKNFQAGCYWEAASGAKTSTKDDQQNDQKQAVAATKIANMLQYYGYLNEAQLRNMRLAVDPLYHYKNPNKNDNSSSTSTIDPPEYGASIKQIRTYLQNNSGLGQGDIQSESYRYLNMPSQATGYMTGKVIFQNCYESVKKQYESNNTGKKFLENKKEVQKLFDLMLRNGEIPLQVLENAIKKEYKLV